jgi:hypothetical protein
MKDYTETVLVTQDMARDWMLKNYEGNRNIAVTRVNSYSKQMLAGTFHGEWDNCPITFDVEGFLIDGQHRLAALIKSGCSLPFRVLRNAPIESRKVLNRGRPRSVANILQMEYGVSNATATAAVARLIYVYDGHAHKLTQLTPEEIVVILDEYEKSFDWYSSAPRQKYLGQSFIFAPLVWIERRFHVEVKEFAESLYTGENLPVGSPILRLREHTLTTIRSNAQQAQLFQSTYTFSALRAYVDDRPLRQMRPGFKDAAIFRRELGRSPECDFWHEPTRNYYKRTRKKSS